MRKPTAIEDVAVGAALIAAATWGAIIWGAVTWWRDALDLNDLGPSDD